MNSTSRWTEADFEQMSWHDNHVHGIQIRAGVHGSGELILDLDYIVEWLCEPDGSCRFCIAPATLTFREVYDLRFSLDYKAVSAGITPFSIHQITRSSIAPSNGSFHWCIEVNWPKGSIEFSAAGFVQQLRSDPVVAHEQLLSPDQRTT